MSGAHEGQPEQSLTERATEACREAHTTLRTLLGQLPHEGTNGEIVPESEELARAIGTFVNTNLVELGNITYVELTPELTEVAGRWMEKKLRRQLVSTMYSSVVEQKRAEIDDLLHGSTITATSLRGAFGVSDGLGLKTSPDGPREVTAPFLKSNPEHGVIWLGTPDCAYKVHLFNAPNTDEPAAVIVVV